MKTLVSLLPWWSFALLFANIILAGTVLILRRRTRALASLTCFRLYLWYSVIAGLVGFGAICITPVGSLTYWYVVSSINVVFNLVLFLLCAQVIDQAIHRKNVQAVKTLWLIISPTVLGIIVVVRSLYPYVLIKQSLNFDFWCAVCAAAIFTLALIKPPDLQPGEPWVKEYRLVIAGLAVQIIAMCVVSFWRYPSAGAEIFSAVASLATLAFFGAAAMELQPTVRRTYIGEGTVV